MRRSRAPAWYTPPTLSLSSYSLLRCPPCSCSPGMKTSLRHGRRLPGVAGPTALELRNGLGGAARRADGRWDAATGYCTACDDAGGTARVCHECDTRHRIPPLGAATL